MKTCTPHPFRIFKFCYNVYTFVIIKNIIIYCIMYGWLNMVYGLSYFFNWTEFEPIYHTDIFLLTSNLHQLDRVWQRQDTKRGNNTWSMLCSRQCLLQLCQYPLQDSCMCLYVDLPSGATWNSDRYEGDVTFVGMEFKRITIWLTW